jgi:hypothetical protein
MKVLLAVGGESQLIAVKVQQMTAFCAHLGAWIDGEPWKGFHELPARSEIFTSAPPRSTRTSYIPAAWGRSRLGHT